MRFVFFRRIDGTDHLAVDVFYRADLGPQVIDRLMGDVAVGALGADALGVLEVDAALIFGQRLLHGVAGNAEGGIAGFMEYGGSPGQQRRAEDNPQQQKP